ncbi:DUF4382 domain-containing protein [Photobacterium sp. OFAV2-7]|uniref:DUF4382 domain-containing protein n=1 Tax=Photobacterium sp. OFAV2-7 TaxID=2917748 RepID=UPI001EF4EF0C|nr:DUF4382 domain-containing protein [Photobacterium sp. OFAV2-7]MCG7585875.1 DUF4382 domain-containing protein [Photobacterium sp. OFAV2-7]
MRKLMVASVVSLALVGCGSGSSGDSSNTVQFNLAFSDAPVDGLSKVCVAFDKITVHHTNGGESSWGTTSFASDQSSAECIPDGLAIPQDSDGNPAFMVINLMAYQGEQSLQVLSDEQMEAGQYTQMRLSVLEKGNYTDGTPYSHVVTDTSATEGIRVPSGELKLDGFDVQANATQAYTLEFDLRKSMVENANGYQLKPRGVRLGNNQDVATISGEVTLGGGACGNNINDAFVYVYTAPTGGVHGDLGSANEPYTSVGVDSVSGKFEVGYVPLGSYDVVLVCNGSEDDPENAGDQLTIDSSFVDEVLTASGRTFTF